MMIRFTPRIRPMIWAPFTIFSGVSSMRRWSAVRQGSHSTPSRMIVSILTFGGGESFTNVGNVAPPIPTMPASPTRAFNAAGSASCQFSNGGSGSAALSSPSLSITTAGSVAPAGPRHVVTSFTVPLVGLWTAAETNPPGSPRSWPRNTWSPFWTTIFAGAPICC